MKPWKRVALVAGGYVAALLLAASVVGLWVLLSSGPAGQASSGMLAFGDAILFLGVFGIAAIPATGAALYFLRPFPSIFKVASMLALAVTATGPIALAEILSGSRGSVLGAWSPAAPLRIVAAPFLASAFGFCGLFAPSRLARLAFFVAAAIEAIVFVAAVLVWLLSAR
jgi:hypothetical protein